MAELQLPRTFECNGNVAEKWTLFKQQFTIYLTAAGKDDAGGKTQCALLLHALGSEYLKVYNSFKITPRDENQLQPLIKKFDDYFLPKKNLTFEHHNFFSRDQLPGETYDHFITELKTLAKSCEFGGQENVLIRGRIICGIKDDKLRQQLLKDVDASLDKVVQDCRLADVSKQQTTVISKVQNREPENTSNNVHAVRNNKQRPNYSRNENRNENQQYNRGHNNYQNTNGKKKRYNNDKMIENCRNCGETHKINQCKAFGKQCTSCRRFNHFAKFCRSRATSTTNTKKKINAVDVFDDDDSFFIGTLYVQNPVDELRYSALHIDTNSCGNETEWYETLKIEGKTHSEITVKLDTGAERDIIPIKCWEKIKGNRSLRPTVEKLRAYGDHLILTLGIAEINVKKVHSEEYVKCEFHVVNEAGPIILGLQSCVKLNLIKRIHENAVDRDVIGKYKDVFTGIGCIEGEYEIKLAPNAEPRVIPARKIPVTLREKIKAELDRMVACGILKKTENPTDWVNPMVVSLKRGKLRICIDPVELNKYIKRQHYQMPTMEEILSELSGAKVFSKLDACQGFYQIKLSEKSTELCTIATPFGRYSFLRLPFGISSAPEIFHAKFAEIFGDLHGVNLDDIIVHGKDKAEHDKNLKALLDRARKANITFNAAKCEFYKDELTFLGHRITATGVRPDEQKIQAILNIKPPKDKKEVERILGIVTYVAKFIPNLADVTKPLRDLKKDSTEWQWQKEHDQALTKVKNLLTNAPVLQYFDSKLPVTLSVDASKNGLGAVLLQNNLPVLYASKSLTETQIGYAQIEKEALAIAFACHRFHQYIFGRKVNVESDHKPLETIFKKSLNQCPARLQRIRLRLQQYDLNITYKPGKFLYIADTLSRSYATDDIQFDSWVDKEITRHVCLITKTLPASDEMKKKLIDETEFDPVLKTLKNYTQNGWPDKPKIKNQLKTYYGFREEITEMDGLLFKNNKIIIPAKMRPLILDKIHYNHLGAGKCKLRARDSVYWPTINSDIENFVADCRICQKYKNANPHETLVTEPIPSEPWERLGVDLFHLNNSTYVLVVDYYSKFVEIEPLKAGQASYETIKVLKSIFARHDIPKVLRTDGGPQFSADIFKNFCKEWEIEHRLSSPKNSQSNGMAERHIQTAKRVLQKSIEDGKDMYMALLELRNTPIGDGIPSPAEILFGRNIRGALPRPLNRKIPSQAEIRNKLEQRQEAYIKQYNKNKKDLPMLKTGDKVIVQKEKGASWKPAKVIGPHGNRTRSYDLLTEDDGVNVWRNRKFIRSRNVRKPSKFKDYIM